jgi:hypothetical protein
MHTQVSNAAKPTIEFHCLDNDISRFVPLA